MNAHGSRERALLDDLRRAHRYERAPADLRRRMLERFDAADDVRKGASSKGSSVPFWPGLRVLLPGLALLAVVAVLWSRPPLALGPEPAGTGSRLASSGSERPCPLDEVPRGATLRPRLTSPDVSQDGLSVHTFGMATGRCGVLERRYLQYVPRALKHPTRAPVMILLHDGGSSAERLRVDHTRWYFDAAAEHGKLVLVYANAAPSAATSAGIINSGGWQTDEHAHPQLQDHAYLARILDDMGERGVIAGDNDVFLVGYGAGAAMALAAAAQRPDLYAGVAAFMPFGMYAAEPPREVEKRRLSRALFVLYDEPAVGPGKSPLAVAEQWAIALGVPLAVAQAQRMVSPPETYPGVKQLDIAAPASGGPAVRVTILNGSIDPFPMPGPQPPFARQLTRSWSFRGADEVWAFLTGVEPLQASFVDDELEQPYDLDPVFRLDAEIVRAPPRSPKR
jgi:predicted esterase